MPSERRSASLASTSHCHHHHHCHHYHIIEYIINITIISTTSLKFYFSSARMVFDRCHRHLYHLQHLHHHYHHHKILSIIKAENSLVLLPSALACLRQPFDHPQIPCRLCVISLFLIITIIIIIIICIIASLFPSYSTPFPSRSSSTLSKFHSRTVFHNIIIIFIIHNIFIIITIIIKFYPSSKQRKFDRTAAFGTCVPLTAFWTSSSFLSSTSSSTSSSLSV